MEKPNQPNAPLSQHQHYGWSNDSVPRAVMDSSGGGAIRRRPDPSRIAPMEGAVLYQKRIDNSTVRYRHDPHDRAALRTHVSWGLFVVFLLVLTFGPRLWVRHLGYRHAQLTETIERLTLVRDQLKVHRGRLQDLRRVAALAEERGLGQTEESSYTWFAQPEKDSGTRHAVAQLIENSNE